jgi:hypothetical protein
LKPDVDGNLIRVCFKTIENTKTLKKFGFTRPRGLARQKVYETRDDGEKAGRSRK